MKERYELAYNRIREIISEKNIPEVYRAYCQETAALLTSLDQVLVLAEGDGLQAASLEQLKTWNTQFYDPLRDDNYEKFYGNPRYCTEKFGEEQGKLMAYFYIRFRDGILDAYSGDRESLLLLMELFLQVYTVLTTEEDQPRWLKETLYYYVHDYDKYYMEKGIRRLLNPSLDRLVRIVTDSDLSDEKYLYYYGENITENEIATARYISSLPKEKIEKIAATYTEGYRQGFVAAGIDLSDRKSVV